MTNNKRNKKKIDKEIMFGKIMPSYLANGYSDDHLHNQSGEQSEEAANRDSLEKFKIREKMLEALNNRQPQKINSRETEASGYQIPQATSEEIWKDDDDQLTKPKISTPVWKSLDIPQPDTPASASQQDKQPDFQSFQPQQFCQAQNQSQPFQQIQNQSQPFQQIQNQSQPFQSVQNQSQPFQSVQNQSQPFQSVQNQSQPFQSFQNQSSQFQQAQNQSVPFQPSQFATAFQQNTQNPATDDDAPKYINITEEVLYSKLSDMITKFKCCSCEHCRRSITLHLLNTIKPEYVYKKPSEVKEMILSNNYTDISQPIVRAILDTKMNPPHKK